MAADSAIAMVALSAVAQNSSALVGIPLEGCVALRPTGVADHPVRPLQVHDPDGGQLTGYFERSLRPVLRAPTADHHHAKSLSAEQCETVARAAAIRKPDSVSIRSCRVTLADQQQCGAGSASGLKHWAA